jgi:hypothetical protein
LVKLAAVNAVELLQSYPGLGPVEAWERSTMRLFGNCSSQNKGCPKGAFLGLCEEGLVKGVKRGQYTKSQKNKEYALRAIKYLRNHFEVESIEITDAWDFVTSGSGLTHNGQMDVVFALKEKGLFMVSSFKS